MKQGAPCRRDNLLSQLIESNLFVGQEDVLKINIDLNAIRKTNKKERIHDPENATQACAANISSNAEQWRASQFSGRGDLVQQETSSFYAIVRTHATQVPYSVGC